MSKMTKGERIKKYREAIGMTQDELAKIINSTKQTIYKYEQGIVTNIPSDKIEEIARALGTTPPIIMGWEEPVSVAALTEDEQFIIDKYRNMNSEGRKLVYNQVVLVSENDRYKKRANDDLDEKNA